jgi:hypothetical protein
MSARAVRVVVVVLLLLSGAVGAQACSCVGPSPICSTYFGSPAIFRGMVLERTVERPPVQTVKNLDGSTSQIFSGGRVKVRLSVSEAFRGAEGKSELTVYTEEQGSACGFPFEEGKEYLVFTYASKDGGELSTSHCLPTRVLTPDRKDADIEWMRGFAKAPPGGRIFGGVFLWREGPMKGATVSVRGPMNKDLVVDEKGAYEVKGLPAGEYRVSAAVPAGYWVPAERKISVTDKGCAEVDWNVTYDGHVRGRVTDVDGTSMANMTIGLQRRDSNMASGFSMVDMKQTGADGRYDFTWVGPGEYFVVANNLGASPERPYPKVYYPSASMVQDSTAVRVEASATVESIDVVMPRAWKKVTVKAKVTDMSGTAAAGVMVYGREVANQSTPLPMTAVTDASGMATLPAYEGQEYYVTATQSGGTQQRCAGPVRFVAKDGLDVGTLVIEHPWGNCLAQLNPGFRAPR